MTSIKKWILLLLLSQSFYSVSFSPAPPPPPKIKIQKIYIIYQRSLVLIPVRIGNFGLFLWEDPKKAETKQSKLMQID